MSRVKELFNFPAGVDVVHIGMQNDLEHHPGGIAPAFLIQLETFKIQALNQSASTMRTGSFSATSSPIFEEKNGLVGIVRKCIFVIVKFIT